MSGKLKTLLVLSGLLLATFNSVEASAQKKQGLVDSLSGQGYGMAGCGLGSILFGEKPGMVQIFASTTNGIYSNNTFGVTSGTSNCAPEGGGGQAAMIFIESNRLTMANDVARGSGETLSAFYNIASCNEKEAVGQVLQKNYKSIFKADSSNEELVNAIRSTLRNNEATAQSCPSLG